jgi:hypothetical protein
VVDHPDIRHCAIGGVQKHNLVTFVDVLLDVLDGSKQLYHVLGVFSAVHLPLMVRLAQFTNCHISSDSTSHIQSAVNKAFHFQFSLMSQQQRLPIGTRMTLPNPWSLLPCTCAVCSALKYSDILGFGHSRLTTELLAIHNAIDMVRYTDQLAAVPKSEFRRVTTAQLARSPRLDEYLQALHYIEECEDLGIKKARAKFRHYLDYIKTSAQPTQLFNVTEKPVHTVKSVLARMEKH